jgi:hypothetical protein
MRQFISIDVGMRSFTLVVMQVFEDLKSGCIKTAKSWDLKGDDLKGTVKKLSSALQELSDEDWRSSDVIVEK